MNLASAADFLSDEFETKILLSENASVFSHDQDPYRPPRAIGRRSEIRMVTCQSHVLYCSTSDLVIKSVQLSSYTCLTHFGV